MEARKENYAEARAAVLMACASPAMTSRKIKSRTGLCPRRVDRMIRRLREEGLIEVSGEGVAVRGGRPAATWRLTAAGVQEASQALAGGAA